MKKLILLFFMALLGMSLQAQSSTVKHTVAKGETLATIAKRYGTTADKIIELNPDASQFVYVGMELTVPVTAAVEEASIPQAQTSNEVNNQITSRTETGKFVSSINEENEDPGWGVAVDCGFGFPDIEGGHTFEVTLSIPYWIKEKNSGVFVSAGLGFLDSSGSSSINEYHYHASTSYSYDIISIPLKVGYALTKNKQIGVTPYIGFNLGITANGKSEVNVDGEKYKSKLKSGKFAPDFRLGAYLRLWNFDIGGHFTVPITVDSKAVYGSSGYFQVSFGYGF